jgi:hypothetical protein
MIVDQVMWKVLCLLSTLAIWQNAALL